jgi:flagellar basal body-associated protein FliL
VEASPLVAILVLLFPFVGAVGMIWFMMSGKGKPAPTQDEIVAAKKNKEAEKSSE